MEASKDNYEFRKAENRLDKYIELEEDMTQELIEKKKQKLRLEKIKRLQKEKERQIRADKLREEQKQLRYLITASEIKWGDYMTGKLCSKTEEWLKDYKHTCADILEKRDDIEQYLLEALRTSEEDFILTLSKHKNGENDQKWTTSSG